MLKFFDWCLRHGQSMAEDLAYVPMPSNVVSLIEDEWRSDIQVGGKAVWQ